MTGPAPRGTAAHRPRKRFGQNFLHDPATIERIVRTVAPREDDTLVEIGPGLGALTVPLLQAAGRLHVIEIDRDLIPALEQRCRGLGELSAHQADALRFDYCTLAPAGGRLRIVGNLPYNISTPLLFRLLAQRGCIRDMHFMLQREVVQRLGADAGSRAYGRLSVMIQYHCRVTPLFTIGRGAFRPPPQVESAFVRLEPYERPPAPVRDEKTLQRLVTQAFSARRKTLRNALKGLVDETRIRACGIDPRRRPEELTLAEFAALSDAATEQNLVDSGQ